MLPGTHPHIFADTLLRAVAHGPIRCRRRGCRLDASSTGNRDRAQRAVWCLAVAPASSDVPGGVVELTGASGVELAGNRDHVLDVVSFGKARPQEHPPDVDLMGDIAAMRAGERHAEVPFEGCCQGCL